MGIINRLLVSLTRRAANSEGPVEPDQDQQEEFALRLPDPAEYGWHTCTVMPRRCTYREEECYGGPPTTISDFRYTIKTTSKASIVFAQLVDLHEDGINGVAFEVANGAILAQNMKPHYPADLLEQHFEDLTRRVAWHEVGGVLRYFILSLHDYPKADFLREKQRLEKGFAALASAAFALGAEREIGEWYKPAKNDDEANTEAIASLQEKNGLARYGLSFSEVINYEKLVSYLEQLSTC